MAASVLDPARERIPSQSSGDTIDMTRREFEFFVTTEQPHQPEGAQRGLIRRLVMLNYFDSRWSNAEKEGRSSELSSKATLKAKGKLKTRFRVGQVSREGKRAGRRNSKAQGIGGADQASRYPKMIRVRSGYSGGAESAAKSAMKIHEVPNTQTPRPRVHESKKSLLSANVPNSTHRFDPFDVLPVPGTRQLNLLFSLHTSGSRINSLSINARRTWWTFISNDAGLLHATLATWALYGMLVRGLGGLRVETLRHKNEAIRDINLKIGNADGSISDELVGIVATLASFENLTGAYDAAQLHTTALGRMVNARGGLFAFAPNEGLLRGIQWVDFHTATVFRTEPTFRQVRNSLDAQPFPEGLLEEAARTSPTSMLQLSVAAVDCFNIFYRLHRLALAISTRWISKVNRSTFSTMLYETEYMILSVPDQTQNFVHFELERKEEQDEDYEERKQLADGASSAEALLAAAQIFVYAALREVPLQAKIFGLLLERLRVAIDRPGVSMMERWKRTNNSSTLLWTLVIASLVVIETRGRVWWISHLSDVVDEMGIASQAELERALSKVAWTDTFSVAIKGVWADCWRGRQDGDDLRSDDSDIP